MIDSQTVPRVQLPQLDSLQEFQRKLLARIQSAQSQASAEQLNLHVKVGAVSMLIALHETNEIIEPLELTQIPLTKPWYLGLCNLRGELTSVIDIAAYLGISKLERSASAKWVVISNTLGLQAALLVDQVLGLVNLTQGEWREIELEGQTMVNNNDALAVILGLKQNHSVRASFGSILTQEASKIYALELSLKTLSEAPDFLNPESYFAQDNIKI